ncbi:uncharacterized protein LOC116161526 isoform X1 [Photinus pyralis]|uniref:uncharacterized protein LOC116161526 isoform X1 n=1 Tax=Photinus pyralis TaxID=7054 RepID=UPI001266F587|nr:uncharacterized protein LOC116161526 isoform X1 [Photinus pyralis]
MRFLRFSVLSNEKLSSISALRSRPFHLTMADLSFNSKRERMQNFKNEEVRLLVDLIVQNWNIIENKTSDAVTWKQKNETWEQITTKFNARRILVTRDKTNLKAKYEAIKKLLKKKVCSDDEEVKNDLKDWEKRLLRMLNLSACGVATTFDGDTPQTPPATAPNDDLNENLSNFIAKLEVESVNISPEHKPEIAVEIHELPTVPKIHSYAENGTWNHWAVTRNKKNSPLRKKRMQKPYSTESINKKYTDLVDERNELVKLQVAVARRELDILNNEEAHKEEMRKLERQRLLKRIEFDAEEHKLRVDLLKKQTSI